MDLEGVSWEKSLLNFYETLKRCWVLGSARILEVTFQFPCVLDELVLSLKDVLRLFA